MALRGTRHQSNEAKAEKTGDGSKSLSAQSISSKIQPIVWPSYSIGILVILSVSFAVYEFVRTNNSGPMYKRSRGQTKFPEDFRLVEYTDKNEYSRRYIFLSSDRPPSTSGCVTKFDVHFF